MAFRIDYPHTLPVADARARIRALGEYLTNKHGLAVSWSNDDQASIRGKYLVVTIEGTVSVAERNVSFDGKDPGLLWRGKARDYLTHKLARYLDPRTALDTLPRR
jgi:hypothetical protein